MLLEEMKGENCLRRVLGPVSLTSLGVGAIIGTGIFGLKLPHALTNAPFDFDPSSGLLSTTGTFSIYRPLLSRRSSPPCW